MGAVEAGLYFGIKAAGNSTRSGVGWIPATVGIIPTILITIGFLPQYYDIIKSRQATGISKTFLALDTLGGVFSILALALSPDGVDGKSLGSYIAVVVLDLGILGLIIFLNGPFGRKPKPHPHVVEEIRIGDVKRGGDGVGRSGEGDTHVG
ncbi:hypothetical protein BDK51DRAFT_41590 [Blyttiomyces helicus]|uniref:PQ loop repeat-domain-containing protein n=1 Tax=Blyttiomyces helicus TaxID=388810 RepID=A0A4P9W5Q3_9FUNG|nr:hypothetical protein BDK51DRAFT_41590 [Blyttiomyces helicus]|eukprot:RKO87749.1 hypothetical protein BDK51DRAFT_41590 [Blyttiomyces helicus]